MNRVLRPCATPRCPVLVEKGHCPAHGGTGLRRHGTAAQRGYGADWQRVRAAYAAAHPWCEWHLFRGARVAMAVVDHRVPLRQGGARLAPSNLQALCRSCHAVKTLQDGSYD
jgi:5-methylcytosine-specific restriction enzyme A